MTETDQRRDRIIKRVEELCTSYEERGNKSIAALFAGWSAAIGVEVWPIFDAEASLMLLERRILRGELDEPDHDD